VLSTGPTLLPIATVDGLPIKRADVVGSQVRKAWFELVGCDFEAQAKEVAARMA
jgi:hypothetical protein